MKFILDPNRHFHNVDRDRLMEVMGILPVWAAEPGPTKECFERNYQFGVHEMKGGEVDTNGNYLYPDDPPLRPVAKMSKDDEVIYFYQHAMVAITYSDGSDPFVTRMD